MLCISCQSFLKRKLTLWGGGKALFFSPLEFFWEVFLFKMGPPKFFYMFTRNFVVQKKIWGFSTFVVFEIFWVKNWKIEKFWWFFQKTFWSSEKGFLIKNSKKTFFFQKNIISPKNTNGLKLIQGSNKKYIFYIEVLIIFVAS